MLLAMSSGKQNLREKLSFLSQPITKQKNQDELIKIINEFTTKVIGHNGYYAYYGTFSKSGYGI